MLRKNKVVVFVNIVKGKIDDPKNLCIDVSEKGHWGNGDYIIELFSENDIDYCISLVKQSYKIN